MSFLMVVQSNINCKSMLNQRFHYQGFGNKSTLFFFFATSHGIGNSIERLTARAGFQQPLTNQVYSTIEVLSFFQVKLLVEREEISVPIFKNYTRGKKFSLSSNFGQLLKEFQVILTFHIFICNNIKLIDIHSIRPYIHMESCIKV